MEQYYLAIVYAGHEWWHAVDNYIDKQESDGFLSENGPRRSRMLEGNKYRESTDSDFAVIKEVFDMNVYIRFYAVISQIHKELNYARVTLKSLCK